MDTRRCSGCSEEKTIRGAWFLVSDPPDGSGDGTSFLCEDCYSERNGSLRGAALERDPPTRAAGPDAFDGEPT